MRRRRETHYSPTERDFRDALPLLFGSREELAEMFAEWEAALTDAIYSACGQAREKQVGCGVGWGTGIAARAPAGAVVQPGAQKNGE